MPLSTAASLLILLVVALTTFFTRVIPFLFFRKDKKIPPVILYLGKVLPPAVIGMLVIYCLKDTSFVTRNYGLPELLAIGLVIVLHLWKRNNLLSIGSGTVLYMILIQIVFQ